MKRGIIAFIAISVILLAGFSTFISRYNRMQQLKVEVEKEWAEVENQLNRRYDLIPNLVETVRGYASHESDVLRQVTEMRSRVGAAQTSSDKIEANNELSSALSRLLVVVESYPDLKANQNFVRLQDELAGTENRIATARRRYNELVSALNRSIIIFPNNFIANMFNIQPATFFEAPTEARTVPQVQF